MPSLLRGPVAMIEAVNPTNDLVAMFEDVNRMNDLVAMFGDVNRVNNLVASLEDVNRDERSSCEFAYFLQRFATHLFSVRCHAY